jgi:hypothetical protein
MLIYPAFPALFIEKTVLSPACVLTTFLKSSLGCSCEDLFLGSAFYSINLSVSMPVIICLSAKVQPGF